jgi:hypothetical protein
LASDVEKYLMGFPTLSAAPGVNAGMGAILSVTPTRRLRG